MYGSPEPGFCDVENILLYNVGAGSFIAAKTGIRVERSFACPPPPVAMTSSTPQHHMRYAPSSHESGFAIWSEGSVLAEWAGVPMPQLSEATKPAAIWHALRQTMPDAPGAAGPARPYALRLLLEVPPGVNAAPAKIVKPLVDGVIAAMHRHDGSGLSELSARLAAQLPAASPESLAELLTEQRTSPLGPRRLLWARGRATSGTRPTTCAWRSSS